MRAGILLCVVCTLMCARLSAATEDDIVPEAAGRWVTPRRSRHMTTVSKLWARMSVRNAAEVTLMETESTSASASEATACVANAEAMAAVQELGNNACKDLAKATINDIVANYKSTQEMLDNEAQKIADCNHNAEAAKKAEATADSKATAAAEKVEAVKQALVIEEKAKVEQKQAETQLLVAENQKVDYGSHAMDNLTHCNEDKSFCWNDHMVKAYQQQDQKVKTAQAHVDKCNNALQHSHNEVEEAKKKAEHGDHTTKTLMLEVRRTDTLAQVAQSELANAANTTKDSDVRKCECSAERRYDEVWKTASDAKHLQTQKVAYTRSKHMLCVVNGVAAKDCTVPDMPKLEHANSGPLRNLIAELGDCSKTEGSEAGAATEVTEPDHEPNLVDNYL